MGTAGKLTAVFLQARMSSSRLPGKALLPLSGRTVIEHVMAALLRITAQMHVLLTDEESLGTLSPYARSCAFDIFAGPRDDVLARYAMAAREYGADTVIRATGDNPLVSYTLAGEILSRHRRAGADYSCFTGGPLGTGVEIVEAAALFRAEIEASDPYEREHVTPYVYRHPELFTLNRLTVAEEYLLPDARVTLDTEADYAYIRRIFDEIYTGVPVSIDRLAGWLRGGERGGDL